MLDRVPYGPVGIALEGPAGIGKTTLWREAVISARKRGYRVLTAVPTEPDSDLAFAGLGDLLDGLPGEIVAALPEPQRAALSVALLIEGTPGASRDLDAAPRAVLSVLRQLSSDEPMLVAIDDEQWLDAASSRVLVFALSRMRDELIGLLVTRRTPVNGTLWSEIAHNRDPGGLSSLPIDPLDLKTLDSLLRSQLNRRIPRRVLERIHATSGGNPLYALAIARELDRENKGAGDVPVPRTLADAVAGRFANLDASERDALLVAAALPHPTVTLLHAVIPGFTLSHLDRAVAAGVIEIAGDRVRFTHPLLRSTLYSRAPAGRRREVHRLLAEAVGDEEQRAHHLARGAEAPDLEIAARIERAARGAADRGAPEIAAELLEEAARLTPAAAAQARRSRLVEAAERHIVGGDIDRARELLQALLPELSPGPFRARVLLQLLQVGNEEWDWDALVPLLASALAEAGDDDRLRFEVEANAVGLCSNRGEFAEMLKHSRAALEFASSAGDPGLIALATGQVAVAACFNGQPIDHDALAAAAELTDSAPAGTYYGPAGARAQILFWSDDYERARPALEQMVVRARQRGETMDMGALLFELGLLELHAGNLDPGEQHHAAAAEAIAERGDEVLDLWLISGEAMFAAARGEFEAARRAAERGNQIAERMHDPLIGGFPIEVLGWLELWTGDPAKAHELVHERRESLTANGFGMIGSLSLPLWSCDIEALIGCGRYEEAGQVVDDLLMRSHAVENPNGIAIAERCRGLLLAAHGDVPEALTAMDSALAAHARRTLSPELARTLLEKGALLRRAKQKRAAKQTLEQAVARFDEMGARMWSERTRDELSRIGLRRASAGPGLTPTQTRVAQLVAAGMSNREIANTLYMSTRSVESHLTKVYRELGVRSRAQLAAKFNPDPDPLQTSRETLVRRDE